MCFDPISLGIATALQAGGAVVAAKGQRAAGDAAQDQAEYTAKVAEHNAKVADLEGRSKADAQLDEYQRTQASQRAAAANSGRNPNVGSAALLQAETKKNSALDTMTTIWNARTTSQNYQMEAAGARLQGKNAKTASRLQSRATLLTGLGSAAGTAGGIKIKG